jgi:hypothetical protein
MIARSPSLIVPVTRSMADSVSDGFSMFAAGRRTLTGGAAARFDPIGPPRPSTPGSPRVVR